MTGSRVVRLCGAAVALMLFSAACADDSAPTPTASGTDGSAAGAPSVAFATPEDGASVSNPVHVDFTATGFTLEPAGAVHHDAGHLHVMVDTPCVAAGTTIPKDAQHLHFGKGQTSGLIDLAAGKHTLCLQAGDGAHTALDLTDEITVTVDDSPSVAFLEPAAGAIVTSPVALKLAAFNFVVEPAGAVRPGAGHLHVMVDVPCLAPGQVIPKDAQHVHLGGGETTTQLTLAPGEHTLCLQAADGLHNALAITRELTITVSG
jgi:hypothetical protein